MRLLITGGAGCLGSNLVERYLPLDCEICVIDNFSTGKRQVLPERKNLRVVEGSISDPSLVYQVFQQFNPTHVLHCAASYKDPSDWIEDVSTNILGSINLARAAQDHSITRFINLQTALCYGRPQRLPIPVDHPSNPITSYGISKTAGETYLMQSNLPMISLRLANICGPRLAIGPIPTFYKRLKAGKDCFCSNAIRDFLDISDFFTLIDQILLKDVPLGVFNVSTGEGHSIFEVFQEVAAYLGVDSSDIPIVPVAKDDIFSVVLDPTETSKSLNWAAKVSFRQTIINQLKWYDQYGVTEIYSHLSHPK